MCASCKVRRRILAENTEVQLGRARSAAVTRSTPSLARSASMMGALLALQASLAPREGSADARSPRELSVHASYSSSDWCAAPGGAAGQAHPAHLHIDLLPCARRSGWGRAMVQLQLAQLARAGVCGAYVCLGPGLEC